MLRKLNVSGSTVFQELKLSKLLQKIPKAEDIKLKIEFVNEPLKGNKGGM